MNVQHDDFVFLTGQANTGKTTWANEHIRYIVAKIGDRFYILDYNQYDFVEFHETASVWIVRSGSKREIDEFLRRVYDAGNCFCMLEEADNYLPVDTPFIRRFVNTARNRGIGAIVSAKRAKSVRPVFRNRFTHLIIFRTTLSDDIEYLEEWSGADKGSLSHVRNLGQGYFVQVDLITSEIQKPQKLNIRK
ncbi:MAG: hypothetical protein KAJ03_10805 [Gammaproteobacteria bacterium]|nr:hypothetical protein [Gammaproteobacteria bacterium]